MSSEKPPVVPVTKPRIRILSYQDYLQETESGLKEILRENKLLELSSFSRGEPFSVKDEQDSDPLVVPIFVTIEPVVILSRHGISNHFGKGVY
jgi:hypothetical protein